MQPVIDSHVHVWDPTRLNIAWLEGVPVLNRAMSTREYLASFPPVENLRAVYLEVNVVTTDRPAELEVVSQLLEDDSTPFVSAVVAGDPGSPNFDDWLARVAGLPGVRGFRSVLHVPEQPRGACLDPAFIRGLDAIGAADMHFELCMRGEELADAATLASAVPDTQLVLDHVGNPTFDGRDLSQWRDGLAGVAEHENVVCKISGLLENVDDAARVTDFGAVVEHARACFGPDRIMFGSNWPVCTIHGSTRLWLESLQEITSSWSDSDRAALFEVNAARFYRIDPAD